VFEAGQIFTLVTRITEEDAQQASLLSQDTQPLHLDRAYAERTDFGRPIAPGVLIIGRVAAALGTRLVDLRSHYVITRQLICGSHVQCSQGTSCG
jgi:acyl dehydratase